MHSLSSEAASLWRSRHLLRVLVRREVVARYTGTAAGAVWLYAQPLATLADQAELSGTNISLAHYLSRFIKEKRSSSRYSLFINGPIWEK